MTPSESALLILLGGPENRLHAEVVRLCFADKSWGSSVAERPIVDRNTEVRFFALGPEKRV